MMKKIKSALVSVSDKSNLKPLLQILKKYKVKIISSGGTFKTIKRLKFDCAEVSDFTGFKEILGGRVKTLHPKIHAGILSKRNNKLHQKQLKSNKFENIDLVIVNFYPFEKTLEKTKKHEEILENIDIGGPAMVRASAKNYSDVTVITNSTSVSTTEISDDIYNVPTFEGTYDILKLQQQLASITSDYTNALETFGNLKSDINDKTSKISEISRTNNDLKSQVVYLNTTIVDMNADLVKTENNLQIANEQIANQQQIDQTEVADLESKVSSLSDTITTLEQQKAEITKERDGWKQLADNWYAVAIEQLRVMTNVLGL